MAETWGVFHDIYCPSDKTFSFLEDVLTEVMDLFPSKYIHVGGDEAPKDVWKKSQFCQDLIKQLGLKDDKVSSKEDKLQSYFIQRIEKFVNSKGRSIICLLYTSDSSLQIVLKIILALIYLFHIIPIFNS